MKDAPSGPHNAWSAWAEDLAVHGSRRGQAEGRMATAVLDRLECAGCQMLITIPLDRRGRRDWGQAYGMHQLGCAVS